jgi:hypothetical protein
MTIFTELREGERDWRNVRLPLSDTLSATASETWTQSPLSSIKRMLDLSAEQNGLAGGLGGGAEFGFDQSEPASPVIDAEIARQRIKDENLDLKVPDTGIPQGALEILIERKKEENRRKDILARGPDGIAAGAAQLGVGLGVSLFDPINVASAFIPVVGPARYAAMLERASGSLARAGIRAGVGVVEGTIGAAVIEPIVLAAARQEQSDYTLADSLLNIALGGVLGGGLHAGLGAASEAIARGLNRGQARASEPLPRILEATDPETREAALRTGLAQAMTGRNIDVEAILRMDKRIGELLSSTTASRTGGAPETLDDFLARTGQTPPEQPRAPPQPEPEPVTLVPALTAKGESRVYETEAAAQDAVNTIVRRGGEPLDVVEVGGGYALARRAEFDVLRNPDETPRLFPSERAANKAIETVPAFREAAPAVVQVKPGQWALVTGATPEDLAAIKARPDALRVRGRPVSAAQERQPAPRAVPKSDAPLTIDQFKDGQRGVSYDELHARASAMQKEIATAGREIAEAIGAKFLNPGVKDKAEGFAKIARKKYEGPHELTDLARGGFVVKSLDQADAVVRKLGEMFDVLDEGWGVSPVGYADRKLLLRGPDGTVAEIQVIPNAMMKAKKERGHALYKKWRVLPKGDEKLVLEAEQITVYSTAADELGPAWAPVFGKADKSSGPNFFSKVSRQSASDMTLAVSVTSKTSTSSQGPLGTTTASASSDLLVMTAGRQSQLQNISDMGGSSSATIDTKKRLDKALEDAVASARASFDVRNIRLADVDAAKAADVRLKEVGNKADEDLVTEEIAELQAEADALGRALGDEELVARELAPFTDLEQTADAYGKAVRAAAACQLRRSAA